MLRANNGTLSPKWSPPCGRGSTHREQLETLLEIQTGDYGWPGPNRKLDLHLPVTGRCRSQLTICLGAFWAAKNALPSSENYGGAVTFVAALAAAVAAAVAAFVFCIAAVAAGLLELGGFNSS